MDDRAARREALFQAALDLPPAARAQFLDDECADDPALRGEVRELLAHYAGADSAFLEKPVFSGIGEEEEIPLSVGPYRIVRPIGRGGMGVVYEAEQQQPKRRIAIKVLRPGLYGDGQLRRFRLECDVLGQMSHPGIAHVYDAGSATVTFARSPSANLPYMAMELIDGRHLTDHVNVACLDRRGRLELFARICDAVDHAHQQAVIHRDLKPSNILVGDDGRPKILDFGVARVVGDEVGVTRHTHTGDVVGTLRYMSPEQLLGERGAVDVRTDVYSLGVILYEMLTGELPHGDTSSSITDMVRRMDRGEPPQPSVHDRTLRGDLDAITRMALSPETTDRYPTAAALAADVRRHLRGEAVTARGERIRDALQRLVRRHRTAVSVAVTFVVLVSISSIVAWTLYTRARQAQRTATAERIKAEERLWQSYLSRASLERGSGRRGRRFQSLENLRLAAELRPSIEVRDGVIASLAFSDIEPLATAPGARYASAYGLAHTDRIAVGGDDGVSRILSLPDFREITRVRGPDTPVTIQEFSPDGRYLAAKYHERYFDQKDVQFRVWDLSTGDPVLKLDDGVMIGAAVEFGDSPSAGRWVAIAQTDGRVHVYVIAQADRRVDARAMTSGIPWRVLGPPMNIPDITSDPEGRHLAAISSAGDIAIWELETGERTRFARLPTTPSEIVWTPDGTILIGGEDSDIYEWEPDTGEIRRTFVGHQAFVSRLELSTDGDLLASEAWDGTTRFWDLRSGQQLIAPLYGEALQGNGDHILTFDGEKVQLSRYVPSLECRRIYTEEPFVPPTSARVDPSARLLITTDANTGIQLWDLTSGEHLLTIPGTAYRFASIIDGPDPRLLTFEADSLLSWPITVMDVAVSLGSPRPLWTGGKPNHGSACVNAAATRVMVTSPDGSVLLDPRTGEHLLTLPGHPGVSAPALGPNGRWAFAGKWRLGKAQVWNLETQTIALELDAVSLAGAFTPDGRLLLVCEGPTMTAYEVGTWRVRFRIADTGRGRSAAPPALSPDGRMVALGGRYDIRLYDTDTGERLATLTPPGPLSVSAFCFTPDGATIIAPMRDRAIHLWDLRRIRGRLAELRLDWQ